MFIPALAFIAAFIAYRHWRTAHDKLRLDLFDRRFAVYVETLDFLGSVVEGGYPASERYKSFARARDRAQYLFGPEVEVLLERIHKSAANLRAAYSQVQRAKAAKDEATEEAIETHQAALARFSEFDAELMSVMHPYLGFDTVRGKTTKRKVVERAIASIVATLL